MLVSAWTVVILSFMFMSGCLLSLLRLLYGMSAAEQHALDDGVRQTRLLSDQSDMS